MSARGRDAFYKFLPPSRFPRVDFTERTKYCALSRDAFRDAAVRADDVLRRLLRVVPANGCMKKGAFITDPRKFDVIAGAIDCVTNDLTDVSKLIFARYCLDAVIGGSVIRWKKELKVI